jgi:SAM-dependent methyltransferase
VSTPARRAATEGPEGLLVLRDPGPGWRHGAESDTERALRASTDRSDMSDELAWSSRGWPQEADCARERGHLLRALDLRPELRVLEVGAGCGAVTRSLAERCAVVDALEPNPDRARLAALRLEGCAGARVLVGTPEDLPSEPAYDLIVIVGVLEYVGGWKDVEARVAWLAGLRERLLPGGHLVCAIENRLGVMYLAGAPEDHNGRLFQGIEDHPWPAAARTFGRRELEAIVARAGLHPTTLGVFPDYRFPRMVFSEALLDSPAAALAWRAPRFPSPPHRSYAAATVMDERRVWQGLVRDGLGLDFANSLLVVAGRDEPQSLWPEERLGAFYTVGRRRALCTETTIARAGEDVTLTRRRLAGDAVPVPAPLRQQAGSEPFVPGRTVLEALAEDDDEAAAALLRRVVAFVDEHAVADDGTTAFDLTPDNLVVRDDGTIAIVDTELTHEAFPARDVVGRTILLAALSLADRTLPTRWPVTTSRELARLLAGWAGLESLDLDAAIGHQADLTGLVFGGAAGSEAHAVYAERALRELREALDRPLAELSVQGSRRDAGPGMGAQLRAAEDRAATAEAERDRLATLLAQAEARAGASPKGSRPRGLVARLRR